MFSMPSIQWIQRAAFTLTAAACLVAPAVPAVSADDTGSDDSPVVAVQVDLRAFSESDLGQMLIKAGTALAAQEMEKDPEETMDAVIKSIGFNPFEQEVRLTAAVHNLEDPVDGLRVAVEMKDSTGNLEGLLLAAPEYRTTTHGDHTIHAATMEGNDVFVAFHTSASGRRRIFLSGFNKLA